MDVEVIAVPFDGSGARLGSRLGPAALELAGLEGALNSQGAKVKAWHEIPVPRSQPDHKPFAAIHNLASDLKAKVEGVLQAGRLPVVLGGEHAISMGSVGAALSHFRGDLALVWIDAHADINTPATSPTGNSHGMPVAALAGLPSHQEQSAWNELLAAVSGPNALNLAQTAWIGLRDVDEAEKAFIQQAHGSLPITMQEIDRSGVPACLAKLDDWLRKTGAKHIYISFDVDVLDPALAPGTGTAVRGGLTYREAHLMAELFDELLKAPDCPYKLVGIDLVEVNPLEDTGNTTAKVAVEWMASLFGKKILASGVPR